ncbi:MAG: hypothetical protein KF681_02390 [Bdellovibrionaceae bacterium]|nr:hypothetical protein [Pseudobdellovibrionaceae bacterium]
MRPGRELNTRIATEVFGYKVLRHKGELTEDHPLGYRPLRNYSNSIEWAWEVAMKMKVTLIPTIDNQWFAFIGDADNQGWESPQAALQFLEAGNFKGSGAAVNENPSLAICMAALRAVEKRATETNEQGEGAEPETDEAVGAPEVSEPNSLH